MEETLARIIFCAEAMTMFLCEEDEANQRIARERLIGHIRQLKVDPDVVMNMVGELEDVAIEALKSVQGRSN